MGQKDILEKILMAQCDVFADCENALAYGGKQRLKPEDMHPAPTESFYRAKEKVHSQFTDVSSYLMKDGEIRIQFIIGNETALEWRQVLRKASYQGGAYRAQLESGKSVYPVIGMVIDWTHKGERIPLSLHALLEREGIPDHVLSEEDLKRVDDVILDNARICPFAKRQRNWLALSRCWLRQVKSLASINWKSIICVICRKKSGSGLPVTWDSWLII